MAAPCSTLFVRNLPYSTTNAKLEEVFSDIGPLRRCFVVSNKGSTECRGFGYVTFALRDDAVKAKDSTVKLEGRKLLVDYANKDFKAKKRRRGEEIEQAATGDAPEVKKSKPEEKSDDKPSYTELTRTVVLSGLPDETTREDLDKLLTRTENISEVKFPVEEDKETTAEIVYTRCKDAKAAIGRLHRKKLKGSAIKADLLSRKRKSFANMKKSRLIVRNISFKCSEDDLKEIFSEYGEISEVTIPKKKDGKMFGFGFVQYSNVIDATKAVKNLNMKEIKGRPVAVDWAVPKVKYEEAIKQQKDKQKQEDEIEQKEENTEKSDEDVEENESMESEEGDSEQSEEEDDAEDDKSEDGYHGKSDDDGDDDDGDDDDDDDDEWSDMESASDADSDDESSRKPQPRKTSDVSEGKTLFVRNIPFESLEEDIAEKFEVYGKVAYCNLLINPDTDRSRGIAFVKFYKQEDVAKCLEVAAKEDTKTDGIFIDGRKLNVTMALSRDDAQKLMKEKKEPKKNKDKRNLYLARVGLIRPGTKEAEGLSPADVSKRSKLESVKRQKLKSLDIFISPTRLSVHNLPKSVDDKQLRGAFWKAVNDKGVNITEARVMRDLSQVNAQKVAKSRGYAFVEFSEHEHALKALQHINNNPDIFGKDKRPIVEFSLENKRALLAKERRKQKSLLKHNLSQDEKKEIIKSSHQKKKKLVPEIALTAMGQKVKKGLPSHSGPKIRQRDRNKKPTAKPPKDKQSRRAVRQSKMKSDQGGSFPAKSMVKAPKAKKPKRKRPASRDDFDNLVQQYQNKKARKPARTTKRKREKWFE